MGRVESGYETHDTLWVQQIELNSNGGTVEVFIKWAVSKPYKELISPE